MKSIDMSLSEKEMKFLIDLIWKTSITTVKVTASRHGIDSSDVEGHLVKCLGYLYLEND